MKERNYNKRNINWGGGISLIITAGLLIGGVYLTVINGTAALNAHNSYHLAIDKSERFLYTAENTKNSTLMAQRLSSGLHEIENLSGNYDWCDWYEISCVITIDTDFDSIKESISSAVVSAQNYNGTMLSGLDYQGMVSLIENILYDMDAANNITTHDEWNADAYVIGSVIMIVGGVFFIFITKFVYES